MNDPINATFELIAALCIVNCCRVAVKDKAVKGVSVLSMSFFAAWGAWNLFYYPSLGQGWSCAAGAVVMVANSVWVGLMIYYRRRQ